MTIAHCGYHANERAKEMCPSDPEYMNWILFWVQVQGVGQRRGLQASPALLTAALVVVVHWMQDPLSYGSVRSSSSHGQIRKDDHEKTKVG